METYNFIVLEEDKGERLDRQRVTYTPTGGVCSKMMIVDSEDNVIIK